MKRNVYKFAFEDGEQQHRDQVAATEDELIQLIGDVLTHTHQGLDYIGGLPSFDKRDKRTLLAALATRSFTSVNCAMNLAVRGYHVQAIMLLRSTHEDDWLFYELSNRPKAVEWIFSGQWPQGRNWGQIVDDIDASVAKNSGGSVNRGDYRQLVYQDVYGSLSEIAHPRPQGLRLQFDASGTCLEIGPLMYEASFRTALLHGLNGALMNQRQVLSLFEDAQKASQWITEHERLQNLAEKWLRRIDKPTSST